MTGILPLDGVEKLEPQKVAVVVMVVVLLLLLHPGIGTSSRLVLVLMLLLPPATGTSTGLGNRSSICARPKSSTSGIYN